MFGKVAIVSSCVLALGMEAQAHAIISHALGVKGTPVRNDVQRPSTQSPCGTVNIADTLDTSTPSHMGPKGHYRANITNFNGGVDGSRQITLAQIDPTGTGKSFQTARVFVNGDENPSTTGTQLLKVASPAGIKCTGGKTKNLCLASFKTAGGFGNCIAVRQAATAKRGGSIDELD